MNTRIRLAMLLSLALTLPPAALILAQQAGTPPNVPPRPQGPCDIYAAGNTPCVTAHSTTRALAAAYNGPLYQVMRQSDGTTLDIGIVQPSASPVADAGGYADAAAQDAFCADTLCFITRIYDQSGKDNHLYQAPPGTFKGPAKGAFNTLPIADMAPITIGGRKAYGVYIMPGMGLRNNDATGIAINDEPEGIYYVVDGTHFDSGCCFDYGNTSTNSRAVGTGTMETTYFGTATAWGSGDGPGPWIMADFEAGLFSGYNARRNVGSPTINSWRFVTAVVNGGGGNKWDLRGGNAQNGPLATFYSGVRPGTPNSDAYFPMNKQGAVLMGNGGDNGNGSAGTFYEGVMTTGYPSEATTDAVQANIVAAQYSVQRVKLSRLTTFTPGSTQDVTLTFTNTTASPVTDLQLAIEAPSGSTGWTSVVPDSAGPSKTFAGPVAPGAAVNATFKLTSPPSPGAGFLTGKVRWKNSATAQSHAEFTTQRVRNAFPIKINEVRLGNQFIELYNASAGEVDISNWTVINTQSQWAPVRLATIPPGTKLAARGFYVLGLSGSGLAASARKGDAVIHVRGAEGFAVGQEIQLDGEMRRIATVGRAATAMTTLFIPVSTGPWLTFPAGTGTLPVTSAAGFEVGQKIGLDIGGNFELATVTAVGKAATQTTLAAAATAGSTSIKVSSNAHMTIGDTLTIGTGGFKELAAVKSIGNISEAPPGPPGGRRNASNAPAGEVELAAPLKFHHAAWVDVSDVGTGITFAPPTRFPHTSGDAVQALGSGITLDRPLDNDHEYGAAIINPQAPAASYQGTPNQWFGGALSPSAGSIALMDSTGKVVVDAMVYGSQQSSSSANGTIASPELATLEGVQDKGGCIVVVPQPGRGGRGRGAPAASAPAPARSAARTSDGADADSNCTDFQMQPSTPGAPNQRP
jgi:hypothetical protein